jgi:hypothetical protein
MLAIVGEDGNLTLYAATGAVAQPITTDAAPQTRLYQWPTWSTDGRLAFFGVSADRANPYSLGVFVIRDPAQTLAYQAAWQATDAVFTYAYWGTGDCGAGDCRDLALLYTPQNANGLALRLIRDDGGGFSDRLVGQAAPFYFSFSPDATRMIWHRFGSRLDIYDVAGDQVAETLADTPGEFASPMWSPVDDRLLLAVRGRDGTSDLVVAQGNARRVLLAGVESGLSFAWSPDARRVTVLPSGGKLAVLDAQTGAQIAQAAQSNVIAHFWSPQGDRVAFIRLNRGLPGLDAQYRPNGYTAAASLQSLTLSWYVMDAATGKTTILTDFYPTRDMIYYLNFADQFSRSHRLWSPDGRYLVYAHADPATNNTVRLVETAPDATGQVTPPITVAPGTLGIWSWK